MNPGCRLDQTTVDRRDARRAALDLLTRASPAPQSSTTACGASQGAYLARAASDPDAYVKLSSGEANCKSSCKL